MIAPACVQLVRTKYWEKYWDLSMTATVLANMMTVGTFASVIIKALADKSPVAPPDISSTWCPPPLIGAGPHGDRLAEGFTRCKLPDPAVV